MLTTKFLSHFAESVRIFSVIFTPKESQSGCELCELVAVGSDGSGIRATKA